MNEFELIKKYFNWKSFDKSVILAGGDDCAIVAPSPNYQLVSSVDTFIEGVHFAADTSAKDIAYKALAVNLSDLAAMGASPKYFTLALTLPELNHKWLFEFATSLKKLATKYGISLIGGDTNSGKLSITINVIGQVLSNKVMLRANSKVGDGIFVSNTIGDAAYAFKQTTSNKKVSKYYLERLNRPQPRLLLASYLVGIANSCIDISDGLLQDLSHILQSSGNGALIDVNNFVLSPRVLAYIKKTNDWCLVLAGGDDYELCFTVDKKYFNLIATIAKKTNMPLTQIGVITKKKGLFVEGFNKKCKSYQHF